MLKVMLVDDKQVIIDGLEQLIDWKSLGYEIAAKTVSVYDAIELAKNQDIDLILTDIRMPEMLGMDMIDRIREVSPLTKFIIVSAYSEFEYAKWAIDSQISGYLLKPIDEDKLMELLVRIRKELTDEEEYRKHSVEKYIRGLLNGKTVPEDNLVNAAGSGDLRYVSIKLNPVQNTDEEGNTLSVVKKVYDIFDGIDDKERIYCVIESGIGHIEVIFKCGLTNRDDKEYFVKIRQLIYEAGISDFVIYMGKRVDNVADIGNSKLSVGFLTDIAFYEDNKALFLSDDFENVDFSVSISDKNIIEDIIDAINSADMQTIKAVIDRFHEVIVKELVSPDIVSEYINNIIFNILDLFDDRNKELLDVLSRWRILKESFRLTHTLVHNFMLEMAYDCSSMYAELKKNMSYGVVGDIIEYLKKDYSNENLSLRWIAEKYYLTPAYLGRIFKIKTGVTFNHFLLQIRIKEAKKLLQCSQYKIYEIAKLVGFSDANYFYIKFQESENVSPTVYRRNNWSQD